MDAWATMGRVEWVHDAFVADEPDSPRKNSFSAWRCTSPSTASRGPEADARLTMRRMSKATLPFVATVDDGVAARHRHADRATTGTGRGRAPVGDSPDVRPGLRRRRAEGAAARVAGLPWRIVVLRSDFAAGTVPASQDDVAGRHASGDDVAVRVAAMAFLAAGRRYRSTGRRVAVSTTALNLEPSLALPGGDSGFLGAPGTRRHRFGNDGQLPPSDATAAGTEGSVIWWTTRRRSTSITAVENIVVMATSRAALGLSETVSLGKSHRRPDAGLDAVHRGASARVHEDGEYRPLSFHPFPLLDRDHPVPGPAGQHGVADHDQGGGVNPADPRRSDLRAEPLPVGRGPTSSRFRRRRRRTPGCRRGSLPWRGRCRLWPGGPRDAPIGRRPGR